MSLQQPVYRMSMPSLVDAVNFSPALRRVDVPNRAELGCKAVAEVPLDIVHVLGVLWQTNQKSLLVPLRGRILRDHLDPPAKLCLLT